MSQNSDRTWRQTPAETRLQVRVCVCVGGTLGPDPGNRDIPACTAKREGATGLPPPRPHPSHPGQRSCVLCGGSGWRGRRHGDWTRPASLPSPTSAVLQARARPGGPRPRDRREQASHPRAALWFGPPGSGAGPGPPPRGTPGPSAGSGWGGAAGGGARWRPRVWAPRSCSCSCSWAPRPAPYSRVSASWAGGTCCLLLGWGKGARTALDAPPVPQLPAGRCSLGEVVSKRPGWGPLGLPDCV